MNEERKRRDEQKRKKQAKAHDAQRAGDPAKDKEDSDAKKKVKRKLESQVQNHSAVGDSPEPILKKAAVETASKGAVQQIAITNTAKCNM